MMEKLKRAKDKNITQVAETVDIGDMIGKIDEIVAWINGQAGGEHDPK